MDVITSGQSASLTLDANGQAQATFVPPAAGKYCVFVSGGPALVGVYQGTVPFGDKGVLRIDPGTKRGVRTLMGVTHLFTLKGTAGATVTLLVRPWSFFDYFYFG